MKRIVLFLTALMLCVGLASSCSESTLTLTNEEATRILQDLVPRSHEINVIFYGEGLPVEDMPEVRPDTTTYKPVLGGGGYGSVADIKAAAEKIYTLNYLQSAVYPAAFEGISTESTDGLLDAAISPRYKEYGGKLHADVSSAKVKNIRGRLEVLSAEVRRCTATYVTVRGVCRDDQGETVELTFFLAPQNDTWLLDSPTYI
ncbi:MAG: hypothetical protein IJD10_07810 [Clostridia bacterium]|nr:hypothetical protein [Clostridia bacterium]